MNFRNSGSKANEEDYFRLLQFYIYHIYENTGSIQYVTYNVFIVRSVTELSIFNQRFLNRRKSVIVEIVVALLGRFYTWT